MKLHTEINEVERFGVASEKAFSIKTTAKAFDILSSGLYTDPILAIVRELSCNAWDAHVAAGNVNSPFEIHLPNTLEPWFHVRDFGTGLSDADVMNLYTTYFESTKSDSNAFIGALGLGSKSPFSYTKAFEVVSRFNGMRRTYSVFINEDGVPSIARLGEINTDEHNGLEVRITIASSDWYVFAEKTAKALRWFPIKPTVVGMQRFVWPEMARERLEGTGWKLFEKNFATDYSKMTAVQGNVAYKVDISKLSLSNSDTKILENAHLVGFFDIGELEVAANREEIRYDDRSKAALIEKIAEVRIGVLRSIEEQVDALKDAPTWKLIIKLHEIANQLFGSHSLFKEFVKETKNVRIQEYVKNGGTLQISTLKGHEISVFQKSTSGYSGPTVKRKTFGNNICPESNIFVFYNDLPVGGIARAMEWVRRTSSIDGKQPTAVVIRPVKDYEEIMYKKPDDILGDVTKKVWTKQDYANELAILHKELGDVPMLLTSKDAPIPERAKSSYKNELPIFQFSGIQGKYNKYIVWKRTPTVDIKAGGLYFHLQNGAHISFLNKKGELQNVNWNIPDVEGNLSLAVELINEHLGTSYKIKDVYGFGSQAINKIKKNQNWVNMFDVLKKAIKQFEPAVDYFKAIEITNDTYGIKDRIVGNNNTIFFKMITKLDANSAFKKATLPLCEDHAKYDGRREAKTARMVRFARKINVDLGLDLFDNNVSGYFTPLSFKSYPILRLLRVSEYTSDEDLKILFDYINLIDRS